MKVSELIEVITTDLWITFGENPNMEEPDIILRDTLHTTLSGELLEAEVHSMTVVHGNAIFISLNRRGVNNDDTGNRTITDRDIRCGATGGLLVTGL